MSYQTNYVLYTFLYHKNMYNKIEWHVHMHEMLMTGLIVRWLGVQRYDRCVSVTEKQKADCEYLVFGTKGLTVVALLMVVTVRVGLKTGSLNLYLTTQQPHFFAQYGAGTQPQ